MKSIRANLKAANRETRFFNILRSSCIERYKEAEKLRVSPVSSKSKLTFRRA